MSISEILCSFSHVQSSWPMAQSSCQLPGRRRRLNFLKALWLWPLADPTSVRCTSLSRSHRKTNFDIEDRAFVCHRSIIMNLHPTSCAPRVVFRSPRGAFITSMESLAEAPLAAQGIPNVVLSSAGSSVPYDLQSLLIQALRAKLSIQHHGNNWMAAVQQASTFSNTPWENKLPFFEKCGPSRRLSG